LLAKGKSNPEIAEALYIGRGTVRTHVSNILGKLDAKTRTEAAALARERGLIS
jgi:DNA-binding NarL/FixJ family response regulator